MKFAIDRDLIVKQVLNGYGSVGNDHPIAAHDPMFPKDIPQRRYDPDKAAFYYKKSGYDGPLTLHVSDAAFTGAVNAAQLYQAQAAKAGIKLDVVREPADGYWSEVWKKKPFTACYWLGRPTANLTLETAYVSNASGNDTFWKRPAFDQLLLAAKTERDEVRRAQMYHDMAMMLYEDGGPVIPVFNHFLDAARVEVKGFEPSSVRALSGGYVAERVWLES